MFQVVLWSAYAGLNQFVENNWTQYTSCRKDEDQNGVDAVRTNKRNRVIYEKVKVEDEGEAEVIVVFDVQPRLLSFET